ncbi:MAG: MarR family transcriptional regulator [Ruminococcaceae bacterium]|nr:MarR family transcriptional regulator [Oscillospiraceae bacterium]
MENKRRCPHPTPPMLVNEISRLFQGQMKAYDLEGVMSQDSARLIMRELAHEDGVSQLQLTRLTHLKAPTVSVVLKRMEDEGLVMRVQDKTDQRMVRVLLTERGRAHNRRVFERLKTLDGRLMEGFDEEETKLLLGFLMRMRDNILPEEKEKHTEV